MTRKTLWPFVLKVMLVGLCSPVQGVLGEVPVAFPGAEGFGAHAQGGRGGIRFSEGANEADHRAHSPHGFPALPSETSAEEAYPQVLASAGASLVRDSVDKRIVSEVESGTATYGDGVIDSQREVGGHPELHSLPAPVDSIVREPVVLGYGENTFELGPVMYEDALDDPDRFAENWIVQMSERDPDVERYARIQDGRLHVHDPRGATVWFRDQLAGPVMITYRVTLPSVPAEDGSFVVRDLNNFWMATAPAGNLFDGSVYTGDFHTYRKMRGYYASTGGGKNTTTRMRRYPREIDGKLVSHAGWNTLDGQSDYLLSPDREILVQLVAYDDIVQYYNNGKLFYEVRRSDPITTLLDGSDETGTAVWGEGEYTPYSQGYFGFRSTHSHHVIRDFRVYRLTPL